MMTEKKRGSEQVAGLCSELSALSPEEIAEVAGGISAFAFKPFPFGVPIDPSWITQFGRPDLIGPATQGPALEIAEVQSF